MALDSTAPTARTRLAPISWPAIFASLAVCLSVMLLMTLAGVALGLSLTEVTLEDSRAISLNAAIWQAVSMLVAAIIGGYVAARLSGMRRTADGVLHGAVAWGAATLLYAALATTALGTLTAGMFGLLGPVSEPATEGVSSTFTSDRSQAQQVLEQIGLTSDQARSVVDQLATGPAADLPRTGVPAENDTVSAVGSATAWLAATVLLSLVLSAAGGAIGSRGVRRIDRRALEREAGSTPPTKVEPAISSRPS